MPDGVAPFSDLIEWQAADAIERLSKDNQSLVEALAPFAKAANNFDAEERSDEEIYAILSGSSMTPSDIWMAREAFNGATALQLHKEKVSDDSVA